MTPGQRRWVFLAAIAALAAFYLWGLKRLPGFGLYPGPYGDIINRVAMRQTNATGVVSAVGPDAAGPAGPVAIGDEVIAYRVSGAYATELVAPAAALVPRPPALDWAQAACLMVTGVTAWHLLAATDVHEGDTVLIHGGSGGVGLMALQLAARRGATPVVTASPSKHGFLRDLGALPVAYGPGLAGRVRAEVPGGVDAALDLIGTDEALDVSLKLVADRARIATIAGFARGFQEGIKVLGGANYYIATGPSNATAGQSWSLFLGMDLRF